MKNRIQIVSFDVPYPPDYGGVIDVFYKIKAIYKEGVDIYLHVFEYGKGKSTVLEKYCKKVFYYKRKKNISAFFSKKPFIVKSRQDEQLIKNLNSIKAPVLFEGLHTTYPLYSGKLSNPSIVRTHNIEHTYYYNLAKLEKKILKKLFFYIETLKLKKYETVLKKADKILAITKKDEKYFNEKYGSKSSYLPVFHSNSHVLNLSEKGKYAFYHGNLHVNDNRKAIEFIIDAFKQIDFPLYICGDFKNIKIPSIKKYSNIKFIQLEDELQLENLLKDAHINVLPTFNESGIKLKLLNSLYNSRFCLVNEKMIAGTGLKDLCSIFNNKKDLISMTKILIKSNYTIEDFKKRSDVLNSKFNNQENAKKIVQLLNSMKNIS